MQNRKQHENPILDDEGVLQCHFNPFGINPEEEKFYTNWQLA
ncbi:MAG: hypothetical protein ACMG6E_04925 [Candidatus Roizmanbacteria bacterium]